MQIKSIIELSAASLTAFLVACFSPTHQEGLACSEEGLCPSGLACSADQICRSPDTVADGGSLDDAPRAPDAGLSDGGNVACEFSDTSICASGPIQPAITISGDPDELNTDTDARCREFTTAAGSNVCLIYTDSFEVLSGGVLRVVGSKPLFIASVGSIEIHGNVDASSSRNGSRGGGSNSSDCLSPIPADSSNSGGGGGAG
ncbi:MAG: hypothetical protein JKY56_06745, partial [Kofleriaceae bacterium]|nr:hypothetical protein [Kofleriaceae bacterium]